MESDEDFNPSHCSIASLSGIWSGERQSQTGSLQNPPQSPFNKGGLKIFTPLKGGEGGF